MTRMPYAVQLSHDGKRWNSVAAAVDQHKACLLLDALADTGHDRVRVRCGSRVVVTRIAGEGG